MSRKTTEERFWEKVRKTSTCWLWTASVTRYGYGQFRDKDKVRGAHRVAYELLVGPIPEGLHIDHLCRVPRCVNPEHMEPVTSRENTLRGINPAADNARKTHCPQGHPYSEENTYYKSSPTKSVYRICKICEKKRKALQYAAKKAAARSEGLEGSDPGGSNLPVPGSHGNCDGSSNPKISGQR